MFLEQIPGKFGQHYSNHVTLSRKHYIHIWISYSYINEDEIVHDAKITATRLHKLNVTKMLTVLSKENN